MTEPRAAAPADAAAIPTVSPSSPVQLDLFFKYIIQKHSKTCHEIHTNLMAQNHSLTISLLLHNRHSLSRQKERNIKGSYFSRIQNKTDHRIVTAANEAGPLTQKPLYAAVEKNSGDSRLRIGDSTAWTPTLGTGARNPNLASMMPPKVVIAGFSGGP